MNCGALCSTHCYTETFENDVRNPKTLKQFCLNVLHLKLSKRDVKKDHVFVDFTQSLKIIDQLEIPKTLQLELAHIYNHCEMHKNLKTILPIKICAIRFLFIQSSQLCRLLKEKEVWKSQYCFQLFTINQLKILIQNVGLNMSTIQLYRHCKIRLRYFDHS